ncbi:peptidase domain-containing ABC transporter [Dyadobacter sp. SG02]|uniref:peptidase domain-containing ABC transporter n=1 Tax=Dyadobacter sp. SG02 TaxID=1855291 RepID=UPI001E37F19D|nr:peptidase domain-containing ABC transporter [Dyadobacter sp. SG02]
MLVVTLLQLCLPFLSKAVIDVGIKSGDLTFIQMVLVANIAIATSMMVGNVGRDWILQHISSRVNLAMVSEYLIKLLKLPVSFFETKSVGDILQRAQDLERIRSFIMNNWLNTVFSAVSFLVFSFVLFIFNLKVFAIFAVGSLVYIGWVMAFLNIRKKLDWDYFELIAKNQSYWVEIVESIYDIKNFNYDTSRRWAWERIQASLYRTNLRALGINNLQNSGAGFIDSLKNILITFFCATQVIQGTMSFGVMVSTQFIIGSLNGPVSQFIQFIIALQAAKISYSRLSEVHEIDDETASDGMITVDTLFKKDIVLSNVTYLYSPNQPPVVRGVGFVIPQGKVTAIVGASGSGKSTLLKMLLRLYNPSYGDIFIGDMNLRNISLRDWRSRCGAVMQEGRIFNDTVLNNIILEDSNPDMERYNNAILAANIATEIEQMPQGYHTKLGEDGQGISGGQRQRILIARALYREPEYLFLDEATNSLDAVNERKVIDALENAYRGKTVVVVAHRLSTIINADQIVVLDKGYVVEQGSHTELFEKGGAYWRLVSTQFSHQTL